MPGTMQDTRIELFKARTTHPPQNPHKAFRGDWQHALTSPPPTSKHEEKLRDISQRPAFFLTFKTPWLGGVQKEYVIIPR